MSVGYPTTTTTLTPPVEARYVRIEVLGSQDGGDYSVGIRMELYGCAVSADVTPQGNIFYISLCFGLYIYLSNTHSKLLVATAGHNFKWVKNELYKNSS